MNNLIKNADGSTGYITSANKFQSSSDIQYKYSLLKNLGGVDNVAKTRLQNISGTTGNITKESYLTATPCYLTFLSKLQDFHFAPPSDNLWVLRIQGYTDAGKVSSLQTLFNSILQVNEKWNSKISTKWKIDESKGAINENYKTNQYISQLQQTINQHNIGIFLANRVSFTPISASINENIFTQGNQMGGFLKFGKVVQSRTSTDELKVNFLVSNWDIGDILFDRWIAAVSQKGLIQDGQSSIKSRIIIDQYSMSTPYKSDLNQMVLRKQYIFENCFPINRGEVVKQYDNQNAGVYKNSVVTFKYDDYKITYH